MSIGVWKPAKDQVLDESSLRSLLGALPNDPLETIAELAASDFLAYRFMVRGPRRLVSGRAIKRANRAVGSVFYVG